MKSQAIRCLLTVAILAGSLLSELSQNRLFAQAPAAETAPAETAGSESRLMRFLTRDYLFGDWGGWRKKLSERGVDFEFLYFGAVPSNFDGGIDQGTAYQGALLGIMDLDSEKLAGYEGGHFHVGSLYIHGEDHFSDEHIGDFNKVSLLDLAKGAYLWELWYEQAFLERKVALKFGQMSIDRDFIVPEFYSSLASINFLNQTFFYPTLAFNVFDLPFFPEGYHALTSTPYSSPALRLRIDPCPHMYLQAAAYDGKPDLTHGGTRVNLNEAEGALLYFELGIKLNQAPGANGLPGNLKFGGYYHTDDFFDMYQGTFAAFDNVLLSLGAPPLSIYSNPAAHAGNHGLYFLADQTLWRETSKDDPAQQGLVGFVRAAVAPDDRNVASHGVDGGLVYRGPIPGRDWDTLGVGASYLRMSDELRRAQSALNEIAVGAGQPPPFTKLADYEAAIELSYKAQLTAWWTLQTSVERTFHPGGRLLAATPDSWAVVVQTVLRF
jgi:porin